MTPGRVTRGGHWIRATDANSTVPWRMVCSGKHLWGPGLDGSVLVDHLPNEMTCPDCRAAWAAFQLEQST